LAVCFDISAQNIGPVFKSQTVLILAEGTDTLCRNVGKGLSTTKRPATLRKIPEERIYNLHRGGNLKSRFAKYVVGSGRGLPEDTYITH